MPFERVSTEGLVPLPFDKTLTTTGTPEDLLVIPVGLIGVSVNLTVIAKDARIAFDAVATPTAFRVTVGDTYQETGLHIRQRISFRDDTGGKPRVYGLVWARRK